MNTDAYRKQLLEQLAALKEQESAASDAAKVVELDQTSVGRLSRMDAMQAQAMAQATLQRRKQEIVAINAALKRIDSEDFGYCLDCDELIAEPRLKHNPSVALCLSCAAKTEA